MEICWDTIDGLKLTSRGNFRKGTATYIYKDKCLECDKPFLTVKNVMVKKEF